MFKAPFVRSAFNYDMSEASDRSGLDCQFSVDEGTGERIPTPSLAKQSFAEECDINTIVRRFGIDGQLPVGVRMPTYADFLNVPSYHEAMNAIREANESFMMLPARVRERFFNDPDRFVAFCSDEKNRQEAVDLGLVMPLALDLAAPAAPLVAGAAPTTSAGPAAAPAAP